MRAERDPWARADFVRRVGLYPIEYLVFVDGNIQWTRELTSGTTVVH